MVHFEQYIQTAYAKIDKYTPRDWRMYNEGKDSGYSDGYSQKLSKGHDDGWDEAKEYYQKIFERELREAKDSWQRTFDEVGSLPFELMDDDPQEELPNDEWENYKKDSDW
jgi:flagellar biosynthesis/type III secretory pathway protein FliH